MARTHQVLSTISNRINNLLISVRSSVLSHTIKLVYMYANFIFLTIQFQKAIPDESKLMKEKLNTLYQDLLLSSSHSTANTLGPQLLQLFNAILSIIRDATNVLSSIWKASINTLIKLLSYSEVVHCLKSCNPPLDCDFLIQVFLEAKIDPVDSQEEEQKLLLKQKMLVKIEKTFNLSITAQLTCFNYLLSVVKKQIIDDVDQYYSLQFGDATKKNLHKMITSIMQKEEIGEIEVKKQVIVRIMKKCQKYTKLIGSEQKKNQNNIRIKEYICFLIKQLEDCLKKLKSDEEIIRIIGLLKPQLIETICTGAECEEIMIRNQAQQLFSSLLSLILDNKLPLREELEILLVKVVLKPALNLAKKLNPSDTQKKQLQTSQSSSNLQSSGSTPHGDQVPRSGSFSNSIANSSGATMHDSDYENDDFIQVNIERSQQDEILLEMSMNYILETLMQLKPQQLAQLFLLYDCQPFSENFITKSLLLLLKYSQTKPELYFRLFNCLIRMFQGVDSSPKIELNGNKQGNQLGMQMVYLMLEQKAQTRRFAKDLNAKYKTFLTKLDDMYSYMETKTPAEVASKILAYSREVEINKVIEVIGGKEERNKRVMEAFLDKMDWNDGDIEQCMRRYLQTFRLAGVDSQVVSRIIETFSHKFFEMDTKGTFKSKVEAFDFAYLIIVLQTSQHNPSIKSKIDQKSFIEQALVNLPLSKDSIPSSFFENIYNSVTNISFFTPISRSIVEENFNIYSLTEVDIRLAKSFGNIDREITESEFVNSADLTNKQLFHYSNTTKVPETLIPLAEKHLLTFLTQRFIKYVLLQDQKPEHTQVKFDLLTSLVQMNKLFQNFDLVDKLFQLLYKTSHKQLAYRQPLETLLWDNFDCLKRSLILLPKLSMVTLLKNRSSLRLAIQSTERLIKLKYDEKRRQAREDQVEATVQQNGQKTTSFFDLVYNYFTDNAEKENEREKERKNEIKERDEIREIKQRIMMEDREGDYQEDIDEDFDEMIEEHWAKERSRLQEFITMICGQIRDNQNQEEGTLCLAFLEHVIKKSDHSNDTLEKLWIEMHLLVQNCLKIKSHQDNTGSVPREEGKGGEYEVISTDTSQDSLDRSNIHGGELIVDIFQKENCPVKTKIYDSINRHLIIKLHLSLSKEVLMKKTDGNTHHIIRETQRLINLVIEQGDTSTDSYKFFDETYFYESLQEYFTGLTPLLKTYPKTAKLIRLMLILVLKSQARKLEFIEDAQNDFNLVQKQMAFFQAATKLIVDLAQQLPIDLINLALDVFSKIQFPSSSAKNSQTETIIESALTILDDLTLALQKPPLANEEAKLELWSRIIQSLQERILLNPSCHAYIGLTMQVFNVIKNAVLSHPFDIEKTHFPRIKKFFTEILFNQTFENLASVTCGYKQAKKEELKASETVTLIEQNDDESDDASYRLEQMCIIAVNNLSDIFIYYISSIYKDGLKASPDQDQIFQLFAYLWLNLLKVLLHYAEKGNEKDLHGLVVCSHDNIKRVIEYLIQSEILKQNEQDQNSEISKLWKTSWDIIGAFFTDMKSSVIVEKTEEKPKSEVEISNV